MADEATIEWTGVMGRRRRWRFIPGTSGEEDWRIEEERTLVGWREIGREPVSDVTVSGRRRETE